VLDILVQPRRNQEAAETFLRRLVGGCGYVPRVVITDQLASYPPALRRVLPGVEHRRHKGLNNRAENSHRPTRRRERVLQRCKSPSHAQQFLSPFGPIADHFRPRPLLPSPAYTSSCSPLLHLASGHGARRGIAGYRLVSTRFRLSCRSLCR
jgi:putative transposase